MTIYSEIAKNKLKSYLIIGVFIFLFTGLFYLIGQYFGDPNTFFIIGIAISALSGFFSYFYSDKAVLAMTGARPASKEEFFDYYTVTENMTIAAGLPMPRLYVVNDTAMNAFATGRDPKHAVVCATTGLLSSLSRSEIEGVIAHELSHVKNYDILLASVVTVLVGTIAFVADGVMRSMWFRGGDDDERGSKSPVFLAVFIISLLLAPLVATLIQLAISRKREFLADATGALISRNPDALASALAKIGNQNRPMKTASSSTAHLFISNPFSQRGARSFISNLFSTHPPIDERIRILHSM